MSQEELMGKNSFLYFENLTNFQSQNGSPYEEHRLTLNTKKNTSFQFSREEDPYLAWRKHVSSEGGLL